MVKLKDICIINPKSPVLADELPVSFVPMPKVGENGEFDPSDIKPYSEVKKGFTSFQDGDVLFAKITPCMENGKGAVARALQNGYGFGSTEFHILRPDPSLVTSEWLYYLTRWPVFRKDAERNMTGSAGQKRVPKTFLENYESNLPSLSVQHEQTKILNLIGNLIALRKEQLAKLDELVKARFVEMFGDPRHNRKSFPVKKLGDLCKVGSSKRIYQNELSSKGVPFLRVSDLNKQIEEGVCTPELFISEAKYDEFMLRGLVPKAGDILVTSRGTLGKCYIVNNDDRFYFQDGMISWLSDMDSNVSSLYISYLFSTAGIQEQIMNLQAGSTVAYLSIAMLKRLDIMLPSILEQEQFSAFVEQTNKSKLTIQASLDKLEVMKKALMQEYFG